ncbi:MAG: quinolinate synthase NadA [Deltaproteobacteria bacterium]|nr:quinolinate synthase NadA [Deltaproteobacteria bacterium]
MPPVDVAALQDEIRGLKERLGPRVLVLTHHYQRPEIVALGDLRGDSFELSRLASEAEAAEEIVFCGVHFMAESAAVLARPGQRIYHPNLESGCPMADMAEVGDLERAWQELRAALGEDPGRRVLPLAYMNTTAAVKAFVGARGGAICTSSNAGRAMKWALGDRDKLLFVPDEHLGRNTAFALGIPEAEQVVWDRTLPSGGLTREQVRGARAILWKGYCHVHTHFEPAHVDEARARMPGCQVHVHPECPREVVTLADGNGSTSYLVKVCERAAAGASLVIGTEINLVLRMQEEHPRLTVQPLARSLCPNMYRINLENVAHVMRDLVAGRGGDGHEQRITVSDEVRRDARIALQRMLAMP